MKILLLIALLTSSTSFARSADGTFTGNGADRKGPGYGAAWFLGDRTVKWCGNHPSIAPALNSAIRKWAAYIAEKQINASLKAPLPFALRYQQLPNCNGADLRIEVTEITDTLSSSELTAQDLEHGWAEGKINLAASLLAERNALETQLLHQLGHLLGNDHVGGTIMAEEVATSPTPHLTIDGKRELFLCRACNVSWTDTRGRTYREASGSASILSPYPLALEFTADLASAEHGGAKLFTVATNGWQGHLASLSLARLALLHQGDVTQQVIVRRNFDKLVEIHALKNGRTELLLEVDGE